MRHWGLWLFALTACSGGDKEATHTGSGDTEGDADTDTDADADADADADGDADVFVCDPLVGDPATIPLAGACPLDNRFGEVHADALVGELEYSVVAGAVLEGVVPVTVLEEMAVDGTCRLLRRNNPFCDPLCGFGENGELLTCDFDDDGDGLGDCIPYPVSQDLGSLSICGMKQDVWMSVVQPGNQYFCTNSVNPACNQQLEHPAFEPGALIEFKTNGTTFGSDVTMHGVGVELISLEGADTWTVVEGQDLPITWNDKGASLQSTVQVRLNIDQHGNTPVTLYCDFPDTGSASLSGALLDQLIGFGVTGFPNATITRRTVDSTTMEGGCVEFTVNSPTNPNVRVDGFVPCLSDNDCIKVGLTNCNDVTFICE